MSANHWRRAFQSARRVCTGGMTAYVCAKHYRLATMQSCLRRWCTSALISASHVVWAVFARRWAPARRPALALPLQLVADALSALLGVARRRLVIQIQSLHICRQHGARPNTTREQTVLGVCPESNFSGYPDPIDVKRCPIRVARGARVGLPQLKKHKLKFGFRIVPSSNPMPRTIVLLKIIDSSKTI